MVLRNAGAASSAVAQGPRFFPRRSCSGGRIAQDPGLIHPRSIRVPRGEAIEGLGLVCAQPFVASEPRFAAPVGLQFEAVEGGFVRWLMVADLKQLPTLDDLVGRPAWQRRAACRGLGTQGFVISRGGGGYPKAKEFCAGCPVRQECLDLAMADDELVGVWGGTTGAERRQMGSSEGVA